MASKEFIACLAISLIAMIFSIVFSVSEESLVTETNIINNITNNITNNISYYNNVNLQQVTDNGTTTTRAITIDSDGNEQTNISGNLSVDAGTLFVDSSNTRIGINKTNPQTSLDISTSTKGEGIIVNSMFIGGWGSDTTYAVMSHSSFRKTNNATGYAFIQSSAGRTFFNSQTNQQLSFSIGGSRRFIISPLGGLALGSYIDNNPASGNFVMSGKMGIGTNETGTSYLTVLGNVTVFALNGTGNAYACIDSTGKIYRSSLACV
jgi:hypothetical protein